MEKVSQTPHDAVFRQMLMHQAVAKDFLQLYLPAPFQAICELDSLQLVSGSFVEEDLRASYSDILYSLRTRHGAGYVYALIEHQSTPDKLMAFRLLRYALAAMQRHLDAGHDTLPLVVPILFYHGKVSPWPWARNWQQLFADPALAKALYSNDFPLVDLTVMPDNQIARHRRMAMLELLQKHIRHRDLAELQVPLIALMTQGYLTEAQLNTLLRYMLQAGTTEHPGALIRTLAAQSPRHKELMMTIAEWLEEKGRKQGQQEGEQEATRSIAARMLARGLERQTVQELTGLSDEELAALAP
ncbi:Rpn family recombination-promoting nuclease/putative transposase [Klebsiella pneumoniae]|uniref:Rpn family recombination-promoting nuclease/putative transposase n=1 Tax=Klebsiella pneumoniae TaxID=573 RepID=UPI000DE73D25|nr:Rpn family recombination-promoting nuclease/putative transposase [Klebsiella pneumoniae]SSK49820.1 transposase [Klebsiella pneumoniae]SSN76769.1 transposase [Klebsiella pneumoniae]HBS7861210.1 Rpn family recombination-promoting nuclease/putative transposase [Klebsiella pneumoniae]HBS8326198.1 Rpn family recombination-promoting nuclease/putative transposase [Klebsiella pneumoniae]